MDDRPELVDAIVDRLLETGAAEGVQLSDLLRLEQILETSLRIVRRRIQDVVDEAARRSG